MEWIEIVGNVAIGLMVGVIILEIIDIRLSNKTIRGIVLIAEGLDKFESLEQLRPFPKQSSFKRNLFEQVPSLPGELSEENFNMTVKTLIWSRYSEITLVLIVFLAFVLETITAITGKNPLRWLASVNFGFLTIIMVLISIKGNEGFKRNLVIISGARELTAFLRKTKDKREKDFLRSSSNLNKLFSLAEI